MGEVPEVKKFSAHSRRTVIAHRHSTRKHQIVTVE